MLSFLPKLRRYIDFLSYITPQVLKGKFTKRRFYLVASALDLIIIFFIVLNAISPAQKLISPLISPLIPLQPLTTQKSNHEVFGFAPHWTINKMSSVDFETLTTLAYFGVEVNSDGSLLKDDPGYKTFRSDKATELFKKAHLNGTKVVLTITQMKNEPIRSLMDDTEAQNGLISEAVNEVEKRGIDGINIDFEYSGNPGQAYRDKFSNFVASLTQRMHQVNPNSSVSVSVYASSVKDPKIYDIKALGKQDIKVFMMAYDFAVAGSDNAIPTSPLHGHSSGKYWYDVATAVDDFLRYMPSQKLILGVPWYGYNYLVYEPKVKGETRPTPSWRGKSTAQTYGAALENITPQMEGVDQYIEGWDEEGQVGYRAYHLQNTDTWRMIFLDDTRSLKVKYDFTKQKDLLGVGIWALGFDDGHTELWSSLRESFGTKLADQGIIQRAIASGE